MSSILALANDYIDRMTNPSFGLRVNEDYALRFADLLGSEGFQTQLEDEMRRLRDATALSSYGWLWLLGWAQAQQVALDDGLLHQLYRQTSSVFVKAAVIRTAVTAAGWQERVAPARDDEGRGRFLSRLIDEATRVEESWVEDSEDLDTPRNLDTPGNGAASAEVLLIALLQADQPETIDAAAQLLHQEWFGRPALLSYFWDILEGLDEDTGRAWRDRLDPPNPEGTRL